MAKDFLPDPKGEPKKKKSGGSKAPSKAIQPRTNTPDRTEQNRLNRNFGKATERAVAKRTGGHRTPGSGAIKGSVHQLEGDVQVRDADERRTILVIECKGCGTLTPRGEHSFTLPKKVLDQMVGEAEAQGAIGCVYLHWKGEKFEDDYVIFKSEHFFRLMELARLGASMEN